MGFARLGQLLEPIVQYCDNRKLWNNNTVLHIVELLVLEMMDFDWGNLYEFFESKTIQNMLKKTKNERLFSDRDYMLDLP